MFYFDLSHPALREIDLSHFDISPGDKQSFDTILAHPTMGQNADGLVNDPRGH